MYLDLSVSPVGLWNFDDVMTDSSGNGYDLSVISGAVLWTDPIPGVRGVTLNRAPTIIGKTSSLSNLLITGDLTVEMIMYCGVPAGTDLYLTVSGGETNDATNTLYSVRINDPGSGLVPKISYRATFGAGSTGITFEDASKVISGGAFSFVTMTRISNQVTFYLNGAPFAGPSVGLSAPTGGSSASIRLNGYSGTTNNSNYSLTSLRICNYGFTDEEVLAVYNATLGTKFPRAEAPP